MLLGKRARPPMKRTTSMSEITLDLNLNTSTDIEVEPSNPLNLNRQTPGVGVGGAGGFNGGLDQTQSRVPLGTDSVPRIQRRHSANSVVTPDFLRACSLCKRRLVPARDIYMYRGDSAFCSLECRQQQMKQDERKEKFIVASKKQVVAPPPSTSQVATKGETVAAL